MGLSPSHRAPLPGALSLPPLSLRETLTFPKHFSWRGGVVGGFFSFVFFFFPQEPYFKAVLPLSPAPGLLCLVLPTGDAGAARGGMEPRCCAGHPWRFPGEWGQPLEGSGSCSFRAPGALPAHLREQPEQGDRSPGDRSVTETAGLLLLTPLPQQGLSPVLSLLLEQQRVWGTEMPQVASKGESRSGIWAQTAVFTTRAHIIIRI